MQVIKRDGSKEQYQPIKIIKAIKAAFKSVGEKCSGMAGYITSDVEKEIKPGTPTVEEIQDLVEEKLIEYNYPKVAKSYILYRNKHQEIRETKNLFEDAVNAVDDYIDKLDWKVNENSNMSFSLQGLNNYITSEITGQYWLDKVYTKDIRKPHKNGDYHIHDLSSLSIYCVGWDLQRLLEEGFGGVESKIESAPPRHLSTALMQCVNFLYTLQGEASGAQAFSNFDTLLAPFVWADDLNYEEVKQEMQSFLFNMNVPTRTGFQSPFTNITMDLQCPPTLENKPAIIGGEYIDKTFDEFQEEMDMINRAFAEIMMGGDRKDRVFSFPIPTYNITEDFDWDNPTLEPVWEMTAKFGIPYFANYINSDMSPHDALSMCPITGDNKVLYKSTRGFGLEFSKIKNLKVGKTYEIFSDGKFVKGEFSKYPDQEIIKVTLGNNHELKMSKEHLNFITKDKFGESEELKGGELKEGQYLPYSLKEYEGDGGDYDLGYIVGAFAGDGSLSEDTSTVFSLSEPKRDTLNKLIEITKERFGARHSVNESDGVIFLRIGSKAVNGLCREFVKDKSINKHYKPNLFNMSKEFRKGVLDGHFDTDGGNRNRIYTSSEKMVESLNMLAASLGTTTSIYEDDRTKEDGKYGDNVNYAVLIYQLNRESYGDLWFKKDNKLWMRIKSIEELNNQNGYCFEVINDEPMFTVGSTGILTHNCRLSIDISELKKRGGGGLFGSNPNTGSIGVVTLNMPRIGYETDTEEEFMDRVYDLMEKAKDSLLMKRKVVEDLTEKGLYPYSKHYLSGVKNRMGGYWKNHFNTIGINGMNEACLNFLGKDIGTDEGLEFSERVMKGMRDKLKEFQEESDSMFNLEATPAESTTYRFAKLDREQFGDDIICANQNRVAQDNAEPYYTNSSQLPVGYTTDIFEAMELQDPLQQLYTGGTVVHGFVGERIGSTEATKKLVKRIAENYELPYYSITPTFSICPVHGYLAGEHEYCPKCDAEE